MNEKPTGEFPATADDLEDVLGHGQRKTGDDQRKKNTALDSEDVEGHKKT